MAILTLESLPEDSSETSNSYFESLDDTRRLSPDGEILSIPHVTHSNSPPLLDSLSAIGSKELESEFNSESVVLCPC